MKTINFKFNIGDSIWFIDDYDQIVNDFVDELVYSETEESINQYYMTTDGVEVFEQQAFSTKKELLEYLISCEENVTKF